MKVFRTEVVLSAHTAPQDYTKVCEYATLPWLSDTPLLCRQLRNGVPISKNTYLQQYSIISTAVQRTLHDTEVQLLYYKY